MVPAGDSLVECKNKDQVGTLLKTKVLGKIKISCQLPKFLTETRWVVSGCQMKLQERKQGIGGDKVISAKRLISRRGSDSKCLTAVLVTF